MKKVSYPVLKGKVIHGYGRGKGLGFPTANIDIDAANLPKKGVYSSLVRIDGDSRSYPGAVNIGYNPTFDGTEKKLEVFLLEYEGDLYGNTLEIELLAYIRDEKKYTTSEALKKQISRDIKKIRKIVKKCIKKIDPPNRIDYIV